MNNSVVVETPSANSVVMTKTLACAVGLGVSILNEVIGTAIDGNVEAESTAIIAAAISAELKV